MRTSTLAIISIAFALVACQRHSEERNTIQKLQAELVKTRATFEAWDTDSFEEQRLGVTGRLNQVSELYTELGDTIPKDMAEYLIRFKGTGKIFKRFGPVYQKMVYDMDLGEKQLSTLDHDLEHGLIPSDSVQFHMSQEIRAIEELELRVTRYDSLLSMSQARYAEMLPKVDSLISALTARSE